jgi:HrpA-like RNA helicase
VHAARSQILALFDAHDTIIIQGETGSGKTTRKRKICIPTDPL